MPHRDRRLHACLVILSLALAPCDDAQAEQIVGLTTSNQLLSFDSAIPSAASAPVAITGLVGGALEQVVGIDRRPHFGAMHGLLYGFTVLDNVGRIYVIDDNTGVASLASTVDVPVHGDPLCRIGPVTYYGVDFHPLVSRLRVVSTTDQNLRPNVDTGLTFNDDPLAYGPSDPNAGAAPYIAAVAYSNNFPGAATTVLRDLDASLDILAVQDPPNSGRLNTQFSLGVNLSGDTSYDISGLTGAPYLTTILDGELASGFYTIGGVGAILIGKVTTVSGSPLALRGIAAPVGLVPEPSSLALLGAGLLAMLLHTRGKRLSIQGQLAVSAIERLAEAQQ
jgi:hypothetical protein